MPFLKVGKRKILPNLKVALHQSSNPAIVSILTPPDQPFSGGSTKIKLRGIQPGTAQITLQIDDGGLTNNISPEFSFVVEVVNGAPP